MLFRSGQQGLQTLIEKCHLGLTFIGWADSLDTGEKLIRQTQPDLVFLDVQFAEGTGFDLLQRFSERDFQVIFVTAYQDYAIQAIRQRALDYLLKPINLNDLKEAIGFALKQAHPFQPVQPQKSLGGMSDKLSVPHADGFDFVSIKDIYYLEADGMYTQLYRHNGERMLVSKSLSKFEQALELKGFLRIHRSYLVNLIHIQSINRNNGCSVQMVNGKEIPIPYKNRKAMIEHINQMSQTIE